MATETLSHRQRVKNAIEHKPVDRCPIDLGVHFSTGISVFAYWNLRKFLGMPCDSIEMIDSVQMLARVEDDILERFHIDTKLLRPHWKDPVLWNVRDDFKFLISQQLSPQRQPNGDYIVATNGMRMRLPAGGYFFDGDWINVSELSEKEFLSETVRQADEMRRNGDYFNLFMDFPAYFFDLDFACDMYTDPDSVHQRNKACHKANLRLLENLLREDRNGNVDSVSLNSDLGMQNAPMLRPEMYGEYCFPYVKQFCDFVHRNSDKKVFLHSCGSIEPLLPYIAEAGVDIINPVQISAQNMNPVTLKEKYGDRLCFWGGGCNTQQVLGVKPPDEVRANVRELMEVFKPGYGFVFNQVHNIMGNVPPENIAAMLDEAYKNSWYTAAE